MSATTTPKRDNLFGVCAAIGADFGFDPFFLRVALAVGVIAAPRAVLIGYAAAALLVVVSRLATRERRTRAPAAEIRTIAPIGVPSAAAEHEPLRQAA